MKKLFTLILSLCFFYTAQANLILTGIVDGPLSGGTKGLEIYVVNDIADLSLYGIGLANNGGGTDGQEYTFPAEAATAGSFIYLANDGTNFTNFFGFDATYVDGEIGGFNGDDAIEVYENGVVIDIFGNVDEDGSGLPWDHLDSWAYRNNNTGPDGSTFVQENWLVQTPDLLDNLTTNAEAMPPFPFGTYIYAAPTSPVVSFSGASVTVGEEVGTVDLTLTIIAEDANATSVDVSVDAASTAGATDYTFTSPTTVTFPASDNAAQTITVTIEDDMDMEVSETLVLTLSNPTNGATLGGNNTYTITINDNDTPIPSLVITEINYNVPNTDSLEFIEIYNNEATAIDMSGFSFANAITFEFVVSTVVNPGEYFIICNDAAAFFTAFGITATEWTSGQSLNNTGETIEFYDAGGNLVDEVTYDDGANFPSTADGGGPSLELCDVNEDNTDSNNWFAATTATGVVTASGEVFATPGAANTAACLDFIPSKINFIDNNPFASNLTPEDAGVLTFEVMIEDGNDMPTNVTVDIVAATATDVADYIFTPITLTFPANVGDDTLTFDLEIIDDLDPELIESIEFRLSGNDNMSILEDSTMIVEIADNDSPTAELVITEINYNMPSQDTLEFIEILNNGATTIDLAGARFLAGIFHQFPAGTTIAAGEYMVLCSDAAAFQNAFGITATTWDNGGLGNSGELIELYDASGNLADMVDYNDGDPFPSSPDGNGPSLELCDANEDNNNPFYWFASTTSTGIMVDGVEIMASPGMANGITCFSAADPIVSFTDATSIVVEDAGTAFVGIELTNGNANETQVTIVVEATSTAVDGTDYMIGSGAFVFPAGTTSDIVSVQIDITDDLDVETDETIVLTLTSTNNAQDGAITMHTVTIEDNDVISNDDIFEGQVSFFPNPVSDQLVVKTDIALNQIRLINVLGQEVAAQNNVTGQTEINVSDFAKGIYFLEITAGDKTATHQVVVD